MIHAEEGEVDHKRSAYPLSAKFLKSQTCRPLAAMSGSTPTTVAPQASASALGKGSHCCPVACRESFEVEAMASRHIPCVGMSTLLRHKREISEASPELTGNDLQEEASPSL
jgi:hypothetical protein